MSNHIFLSKQLLLNRQNLLSRFITISVQSSITELKKLFLIQCFINSSHSTNMSLIWKIILKQAWGKYEPNLSYFIKVKKKMCF